LSHYVLFIFDMPRHSDLSRFLDGHLKKKHVDFKHMGHTHFLHA